MRQTVLLLLGVVLLAPRNTLAQNNSTPPQGWQGTYPRLHPRPDPPVQGGASRAVLRVRGPLRHGVGPVLVPSCTRLYGPPPSLRSSGT